MNTIDNQDWQFWDMKRNKIFSRRGGWQVGIGVHNCGFDMMKELAGKKSYMQVMALNCTGRLPSKEMGLWLDGLFICLSWPDPRIWCNTMGALSGTLRGEITAGVTAGLLSADSPKFGGCEVIHICSKFIHGALIEKENGKTVPELVEEVLKGNLRKPDIPGYARPLATGDERVSAMGTYARELGFPVGQHEQLANEINDYLMDTRNESINIAGFLVAFMADQGFSPLDTMRTLTTIVNGGIHACHIEEEENAPLSFMPVMCKDIDYQGRSKRNINKELKSE